MRISREAIETIRKAIVQELVDRSQTEFFSLTPKAFEVSIQPDAPMASIYVSEDFEEEWTEFAVNDVGERIISPFISKAEYKTMHRDDGPIGMGMKAASWEDFIKGLNEALSKKNRIDPNILGQGIE